MGMMTQQTARARAEANRPSAAVQFQRIMLTMLALVAGAGVMVGVSPDLRLKVKEAMASAFAGDVAADDTSATFQEPPHITEIADASQAEPTPGFVPDDPPDARSAGVPQNMVEGEMYCDFGPLEPCTIGTMRTGKLAIPKDGNARINVAEEGKLFYQAADRRSAERMGNFIYVRAKENDYQGGGSMLDEWNSGSSTALYVQDGDGEYRTSSRVLKGNIVEYSFPYGVPGGFVFLRKGAEDVWYLVKL